MAGLRTRAGRPRPARLSWVLAAAALGFALATAGAQAPGTPDAGPTTLQRIVGQAGGVLPSPDAGVTPESCRPYGAACGAPLDCCSQQCADGRCGDGARSCREAGLGCRESAECCSRFCAEELCR